MSHNSDNLIQSKLGLKLESSPAGLTLDIKKSISLSSCPASCYSVVFVERIARSKPGALSIFSNCSISSSHLRMRSSPSTSVALSR